eukprot:CCRYP_011086-RA/>CCRYP_011086-RA protein AED:0.40 eAED:0.40 QI:82/1/1/1/0/0/2/254/98
MLKPNALNIIIIVNLVLQRDRDLVVAPLIAILIVLGVLHVLVINFPLNSPSRNVGLRLRNVVQQERCHSKTLQISTATGVAWVMQKGRVESASDCGRA